MDNKLSRDRLATHFEYEWYKYLLALIAIIFFWVVAFSTLNAVKSYEQITLFVVASGYKDDNTSSKLMDRIRKSGDDTITQVVLDAHYIGEQGLETLLITRATMGSDIVIVPSTIAIDSEFVDIAANIDDSAMQYIGKDYSLEWYYIESVAVAINITQWRHISDFIVFDSLVSDDTDIETLEYYMFINSNSSNAGNLGDKPSAYTQTIDAARFLVEMYC